MKILIVDDSPANIRMLEMVFEPLGYHIFPAETADEGFETLQREQCRVAIIDWMMPGVDGIDLTRRIRQEITSYYVYIIMVTAKEGRDALITGLKSGVDDFVRRPFLPRELRARVEIGERIIRTETELRRSQAETENARQEWEATADAIVQLVCLLDRHGNILRANRTVEDWGLAWVEEAHGASLMTLLENVYPDVGKQLCAEWETVQSRVDNGLEYEFTADDEKFGHHFEVHIEPVEHQPLDQDVVESYAAITIMDLTERRNLELALKEEHEKSEKLLLNILPEPITQRLKNGQDVIADEIKSASVLFTDLVGFTEFAASVPAVVVVAVLNGVFSKFDTLTAQHNLEKIKTIGDSYMAAGGILQEDAKHAERAVELGLSMLDAVEDVNREYDLALSVRVGVHSGSLVAGVIGQNKFAYDLWGDTVNIASRMESTGIAGYVHISAVTADLLGGKFPIEKRAPVMVKGRGEMQTYIVKPSSEPQSSSGNGRQS